MSSTNILISKNLQLYTHTQSWLMSKRSDKKKKKNSMLDCTLILFYALLLWQTLYIVLPPLFTLCPWAHQSIFFFFSPSRVRKGSCRFCTDTWRSTAQCIMRPRDLQKSRPLWRTTACCPSMSCSNCCAKPRQDTKENMVYTRTLSSQYWCITWTTSTDTHKTVNNK